jgi:hypothetical protein
MILSGCVSFPIVQAPGPKEYQVQATREISTESVKAVAGAQNTKVEAMKTAGTDIALKRVEAVQTVAMKLAERTDDPEALSNINANAMQAIVRISDEEKVVREIGRVDGTAKVVSGIAGKGIEGTETSTLQYGMYAAGQTVGNIYGIPEAQRQFQAITKWGWNTLIPIIAGGLGGGGLIGGLLATLTKARRRKKLLEATGEVIELHKGKDPELTQDLAKAHASLPVNAYEEFSLGRFPNAPCPTCKGSGARGQGAG